MDNLTATVEIKCREAGIDLAHPRKEVSQRFMKYSLKTQVISEGEWWMRQFFAYMILKYGPDSDDWEFGDVPWMGD